MAFKLNVKPENKPNAIQQADKSQAPVEKSAGQNSSNEAASKKKTGGLVIPGKSAANGADKQASLEASTAKAAATAEPAKPAADFKQELASLPAGVDEKLYADFMQAKQSLAACLTENRDMIGYALRRVMVDTRMHPELAEFMLPEDFGNMIKALRASYGTTLAIKEKKTKSRKKKDNGGTLDIDLSDLKDMMI